MSATSSRQNDPAIRHLSRDLAAAADKKITDAVALVDALPERGAADALIEPLRARLAGLHLRRPLNFCRLMFSPLDPMIVPAARWRPGAPTIPRTALVPMADTVRACMPSSVPPILAMINGRSMQDVDVVREAGAMLWPEAGRILARAPPPIGWDRTGLNVATYNQLCRQVGAVMLQIVRLDALVADTAFARTPPDRDRVMGIMREATSLEPTATAMMAVILMARLPQAGRLLNEATLRGASQQAMALLLDQLDAPGSIELQLACGELTHSADAVHRMGILLHQVESSGTPVQQGRLTTLRRRLDECCRGRFAVCLSADFVSKLSTRAVDSLEEAARGLRTFETEARAFGGNGTYDRLLRQAADAVRELPDGGSLGKADRVRLVELLAGPIAALKMCDLEK